MPTRLNPYITFAGNAREAMEFYKTVLGGELTLSTFADLSEEGSPAPEGIMHALLVTDGGLVLMASDTAPGMSHQVGDNVTISLSGDNAEELTAYWDKLSQGGTVSVPLEKQMWGDTFGMCVDRYGVGWMVDIEGPAAQA